MATEIAQEQCRTFNWSGAVKVAEGLRQVGFGRLIRLTDELRKLGMDSRIREIPFDFFELWVEAPKTRREQQVIRLIQKGKA